MRLVVVALAVLAAVALLLLAAAVIRRGVRRWRQGRSPWSLDERSDGEQLCLYAAKPGEQEMLIGAVPLAAQEFEKRLHDLRARGREKVGALNAADDDAE